MGRKPLKRRGRPPLKRNQRTIYKYFNKKAKARIRKRFRSKKKKIDDDESYILPDSIEESEDNDYLDLEDESIESELDSPVISLIEDEDDDEEKKEERTKRKKRKTKSRINYPKSVRRKRKKKHFPVSKCSKKSVVKRGRGRPRKTDKVKKTVEKNNNVNVNSFDELNLCYNKLNDLISKYSFSDIADVILKLNNGIKKDNSDKNEEILFKEISNLNLVLKNKEDIITMCLSILNSKNSNNNINQDNNTDLDISDHSPEDEETEEKHIKKEKNAKSETKENTMINGFKAMNKDEYIFGIHFYNSTNGVYLYYPVSEEKQQSLALFCKNRDSGCKARCVVYSNTNDVTMKGIHNHKGESYNSFCQIHPEFKNKNWEHVQIINENGEDIIIKQC